ncbi:putative Asparagine synthetase [glutamine-hydrolyzing] 1 [Nitrospira japonica]|uniref:asparagine synthase (glutamine-hydrolyzing) n=1 Tax=Nitrospira japonica TaxID=1325564 RepID=A0A1W1IBD5_9BACT|nr:asparagine synthase (glutamine-hydrolyzing) [Nitrospira japonica]SLM50316.1 putative Asparagine synthetase [glutamine-hydrolyzing] 1 [Nitrospira japonica]
MCGIAGLIDHGAGFGPHRLREVVTAMRDTMVHRGPDDAGLWIETDGSSALAHRRLSILDLSEEGRQPMSDPEGSVVVTFNGEIYNYQSIRASLERQGRRFHSRTDTEVLPHLFEGLDPRRLAELDGMFAFGCWHRAQRRLLLARDPFGKKPLYYATGTGWFAFASELHALRCVPGFDDTVDEDALALYLLLQYIPAPWTIYRNVRKLPPGSYLIADFSGRSTPEPLVQPYTTFDAREAPTLLPRAPEDREAVLRRLILEAVDKRLISDVPLGAFLSGGVDSSLVVAMITRELGRPIQTFSIGFEGTEETEHVFARQIAEHLGTDHHEQLVSPDAVTLIDDVASMLDEPNGDTSCLPTYLLCRYTRQFVTVAVSGDGGDEMFGGYGRYRDTLLDAADWLGRLRWSVRARRWSRPADAYLSPRWLMFQPEEVADLLGGLSPLLWQQIQAWRDQLNDSGRPLIHRMRNLDVATYLPGAVLGKVDRMSMQVSLEVRCPLLDRQVAQFAQSLSAADCWRAPQDTKHILKRLAARYIPEQWVMRKKMGFGLPASAWSRDEMLSLAGDLILSSSGQLSRHTDRAALRRLVERQRFPGCFSIYRVWPLLILELWLRKSRDRALSAV